MDRDAISIKLGPARSEMPVWDHKSYRIAGEIVEIIWQFEGLRGVLHRDGHPVEQVWLVTFSTEMAETVSLLPLFRGGMRYVKELVPVHGD